MLRRLLLFLALAALVRAADEQPSPPAKNWMLPLFSKEGFRAMTLRGAEARVFPSRPDVPARIDVLDFNLTTFTGDAKATVDSVLLSSSASFFPDQKTAKGDKDVRLVRDDLEVKGEQWTYDHAAKKITLARHARIVFHAALPDLLK